MISEILQMFIKSEHNNCNTSLSRHERSIWATKKSPIYGCGLCELAGLNYHCADARFTHDMFHDVSGVSLSLREYVKVKGQPFRLLLYVLEHLASKQQESCPSRDSGARKYIEI